MRYYYSDELRSAVKVADSVHLSLRGYREVSREFFDGVYSKESSVENQQLIVDETMQIEEQPAEEEDTTDSTETPDSSQSELLFELLGSASSEVAEASEAPVLSVDESVLAQEEKVAANIFDSIRELRETADPEREARVVKGKAHGVYSFTEGEWKRVGDLDG